MSESIEDRGFDATGLPWVVNELRRSVATLESGRLGHALLVAGPAGLGKRLFARALAQRLLCRQPVDGLACGQCRSCRQFLVGSHADFRRVGLELRKDGRSRVEITVDQVRQLGDSLNLTAQQGGAVVAVLDPADALNASAANALLKTLEEPQPGRYLLLIADRPDRLPATIRSRCQRLVPSLPDKAQSLEWLRQQGHADEAADTALQLADGLPLRALDYLEQGVPELRQRIKRELGDLATGRAGAFRTAGAWLEDRPELRLRLAADVVRELGWKRHGVPDAPTGLTTRIDFPKLAAWYDRVNRARDQLSAPIRHDLLLGELMLEFREAFGG